MRLHFPSTWSPQQAREMPVPVSTSSNGRRERGMWYSLVTRVTCWTLCFSRIGSTRCCCFSMVFFACKGVSHSCTMLGKQP